MLDRYCVACHDGADRRDGRHAFDLRGRERITDYTSVYHYGAHDAGHFSTSYVALHRYVRRPGLESDYHMLMPMEYHAGTTQLVQLLEKGHEGVVLSAEAWDRLITWIDLNAPFHGTWTEIAGADRVRALAARRRELLKRYAGVDSAPEAEAGTVLHTRIEPLVPAPVVRAARERISCAGWPLDTTAAARLQASSSPWQRTVALPGGMQLEMVRIPAGDFVMGSPEGHADERPLTRVTLARDFWMSRLEITNRQFRLFDPTHDSRVESRFGMQFGVRGFYVNAPDQPVVRVSWHQAQAFCRWLCRETGLTFGLPTEAQWEYACRAGTAQEFYYGDPDTDFAPFANLADATLREFVCHPYKKERVPFPDASTYDDWIPKDMRFNDGGFLSEPGGRYRPNAWGLCDMHGNVAEWTGTAFRPYPYRETDGRNDPAGDADRVVRGGSWRDRPARARSAYRLAYRPYQGVYNVGFRVVCTGLR